jgi:ADP-heptose:LPS heptosyltransferase
MGFGDALLATGIARKARLARPGKKICIGDGFRVEWVADVFDNNPHISQEIVPGCIWVHSHKGFRPYVDIEKSTLEKYVWKRDFKASPGELYLTDAEKAKWPQRRFIYIEPNIKGWLGPNKDWGFDKWQAVVNAMPDVDFVQGPGRALTGVVQVETESFRDACALLYKADLFVGTDGGLHHAAAALGKKAVVIWGGFTHPRNLGYDSHVNLHSGVEPCGVLKPCDHCKKAMNRITVDMVVKALRGCLVEINAEVV